MQRRACIDQLYYSYSLQRTEEGIFSTSWGVWGWVHNRKQLRNPALQEMAKQEIVICLFCS